jgi:Carboxypeptidase regulatory-like domain
MYRVTRCAVFLLACLVLLPSASSAQATLAGIVKDPSGAVLPGVTVEASSPALIEKTRTAVTDGTGQYKIVDLRPGSYTVTFTLAGFSTVKREGVELTGQFTATVNAELRVGALEETITVTGETPMVDVQSSTRERVIDRAVMDAIPAARNPFALAALIPGVSAASQDVGGSGTVNAANSLAVHGGTGNDQIIRQNGVNTNAYSSAAYTSRLTINMAAVQEFAVDTAAVSAEETSGGVRINIIPRDGGNTFNGTFIANFANDSMQADNFTQELKDTGLRTPGSIRKNYDINPGFGGPIQRDKLWFYVSGRRQFTSNFVPGMFVNVNANNPRLWTYVPDLSQPVSNDSNFRSGDGRLTWQATSKNRIGFTLNYQNNCGCPGSLNASTAPEADLQQRFPVQRREVVDWSAPVTSRLLFEAGANELYGMSIRDYAPGLNPAMISVTEQSSGLKYRANDAYRYNPNASRRIRAAVSYITGAHAVKVGTNYNWGYEFQINYDRTPYSYRFNNGVPNQITLRTFPFSTETDVSHDIGLFVQDSWKLNRLTLSYGIRFDDFAAGYPEEHLDPAPLAPTRNITFKEQKGVSTYHDITPKFGAVYDLFGTGKTALKVSVNKYLANLGTNLPAQADPTANLVTTTNRSWTDSNGNFIPDCDLLNPAAQNFSATGGDICGAMANPAFGSVVAPAAIFDPDLLHGWRKRPSNWEFTAGIQHEILPRVSFDVGYFRRVNANFTVTDDRNLGPTDFDPFSITAPVDSRLRGGGGYAVSGLYNVKPAKFGIATDNFVTLDRKYGGQMQHWNGVDMMVNARPRNGLLVQGGVSTGRTSTDNCEVLAKLPESNPLGAPYCHVDTPFLSRWAALASYTIPRVDVQVAGTFQSTPGPQIAANYVATNAIVSPSLGRPLSGGAANVTVNLVAPGDMYGERLNQLDLRFGKVLNFAGTRASINVDLYNALNASTVLTLNNNYASWRMPQSIVAARFAKVGVQFDF